MISLTKMLRDLTCIAVASALLALSGCAAPPAATQDLRDPDEALTRASAISTGSPRLDPKRPSTICWSAPVAVVGDVDPAHLDALKDSVQAAIETQIAHKGYPVVLLQGDFQMQAVLVLGANRNPHNDKDNAALLQLGGIDPGLMGNETAPGKGSLVIELRQGRALRWRGAVQVYLLPDTEPAVVAQRLQKAVAELLLAWP